MRQSILTQHCQNVKKRFNDKCFILHNISISDKSKKNLSSPWPQKPCSWLIVSFKIRKWRSHMETFFKFCFLYKNLLLLESWLYIWKCLLLILLAGRIFLWFFLLTFFTVTPTILKTQYKITHHRIFPKHLLTPNQKKHVFYLPLWNAIGKKPVVNIY